MAGLGFEGGGLKRRRLAGSIAALACLAGPLALASPAAGAPSLHVECLGAPTAAPTVILESGAFGTADDWAAALPDLAIGGRVCAYDRSGVGRSPKGEDGKDVIAIATELKRLLDDLGEDKPVILVGHSNGALYVEAFAALWPGRVAGLVYVNGVNSTALADPRLVADLGRERQLAEWAADAGAIGIAALAAPSVVKAERLPPEAARRKAHALSQPWRLRIARDEDRGIVPGLATVAGLGGSPPSIPTAALISSLGRTPELAAAWAAAEAIPAERARCGWVLRAIGATHVSPLSRDRAWLVAAVDWLRSLPPSSPCADIGH
jgi:pimeloyl-ACP methyl ester carboxylesterase